MGVQNKTDQQSEHRHRYKAPWDSLWYFGDYEKCYGCIQHSAYSAEGKPVIYCSEGKFLSLQSPILLLWHFLSSLCCILPLLSPLFSLLWDMLYVELVMTAVISKVFEFYNRLCIIKGILLLASCHAFQGSTKVGKVSTSVQIIAKCVWKEWKVLCLCTMVMSFLQ